MGLRVRIRELLNSTTVREVRFVTERLIRNPLSLIGVVIIFLFAIVALIAPYIAPPQSGKNPYEIPYSGPSTVFKVPPEPPSQQHPFGTLEGYDVYYGIIWATRTAFYTSFTVLVLTLAIGLFIGTLAGYYSGPADGVLMRLTDMVFAFPTFFVILILVLALPSVFTINLGLVNFTIAISYINKLILAHVVTMWPAYARLIRAEILKIKSDDYVESAKAIGCSDFRVMVRHILPNAVYPVLIMAFLGIGEIVLSFATLGFLGLGPEMGYRVERDLFVPMYAEWGTIINHSIAYAAAYPYTLVIPGFFISCFILASTLAGDALSGIVDPAIRRRLS